MSYRDCFIHLESLHGRDIDPDTDAAPDAHPMRREDALSPAPPHKREQTNVSPLVPEARQGLVHLGENLTCPERDRGVFLTPDGGVVQGKDTGLVARAISIYLFF